jgi:peptide deformylase
MNKLVPAAEAILNNPVETFDFANPPEDPIVIAQTLLEHLNEYRGIGLSANQIGLPYRVFIVSGDPSLVCFNPKIVNYSSTTVLMEEGCLTYPGLYVRIKRPVEVRVRYIDELGQTQTKTLVGLTARCFQHELDHLDGTDFTKKASTYHMNLAKKRMKMLKRKAKGLDLSPRKMFEEVLAQ